MTPGWAEANGDVEGFMQRIKKTAQITALEGKPVRDEVHRESGHTEQLSMQPLESAEQAHVCMFGREFPEAKGQPKHRDDTMIRCRDREQKQKMTQYADKRRHTAVMKIKVGARCSASRNGKTGSE